MSYSLVNVTTQDSYTDVATLNGTGISDIIATVANASIRYQLARDHPYNWTEEAFLAPGVYNLPRRCEGIRVRSAIAGSPAQVSIEAATEDQASGNASGSPLGLTGITASGSPIAGGQVSINGTVDIGDRAGRLLGIADILDRPNRLLGITDVVDRAGRLLGIATIGGTVDVGDRAARQLGTLAPPAAAAANAGAATAIIGVASAQVLAARARLGSLFTNDSPNTIYLGLGTPAILHAGITLEANGGQWNGKIGDYTWQGPVTAIASGGASNLSIIDL